MRTLPRNWECNLKGCSHRDAIGSMNSCNGGSVRTCPIVSGFMAGEPDPTPDQLLDQLQAAIGRSFEGDLAFWRKYAETLEDAYRSQAHTLEHYKRSNDLLQTGNEAYFNKLNDEIYELRKQVKQLEELSE